VTSGRPGAEVTWLPFRATPRTPAGNRFDRLFAEAREAVLTGTHQVESEPASGRPRWAVGAVLRPDARAAQAIEHVAKAAAGIVGPDHWLAGAVSSSHLSLRRHLEPSRRLVAWVSARRQMKITELQVTSMQIVRWDYVGTGMVPMALAAAADQIPS
jgi:hypothetical protein